MDYSFPLKKRYDTRDLCQDTPCFGWTRKVGGVRVMESLFDITVETSTAKFHINDINRKTFCLGFIDMIFKPSMVPDVNEIFVRYFRK